MSEIEGRQPQPPRTRASETRAVQDPGSGIELLREDLDDVLSVGMMTGAALDDWDKIVVRHGKASRDQSPLVLLGDLTADLATLKRVMERHRSASALRRLTRVLAQMSGLMCLTLCRLDDRTSFRRWARTARLAAEEAGDVETQSWVLAQEAYGHYYSNNLIDAIDVARHAQSVVVNPRVGVALAAALEARACAALGRADDTRAALHCAEDALAELEDDALVPSAFGYNEAQFRFHQGSAYTRLGDLSAALAAQDRALELCKPVDYTDWAMTRLDRASCLIGGRAPSDGLEFAAATAAMLSGAQLRGIISSRTYEILASVPNAHQTTSAARDLREMLIMKATEDDH